MNSSEALSLTRSLAHSQTFCSRVSVIRHEHVHPADSFKSPLTISKYLPHQGDLTERGVEHTAQDTKRQGGKKGTFQIKQNQHRRVYEGLCSAVCKASEGFSSSPASEKQRTCFTYLTIKAVIALTVTVLHARSVKGESRIVAVHKCDAAGHPDHGKAS